MKKKSYSEMAVIREIEKAVLTGLMPADQVDIVSI